MAEVFCTQNKVIGTAGLKMVVKSDLNEHCQGIILQKQLVCFCKCVSVKPFIVKTNLFSLKSTFILALSPLMDQRLVSALYVGH